MRGAVSVLDRRGPRRRYVRRVQRLPLRSAARSAASTSSGLNFVRVVHIPGNVLTPASWKQVVFIDERASDEQCQAILDAYDGKLGGPLADLAGLIGETLGVERAAITHEVQDGRGRLTIGDVVHSEMHPYHRTGRVDDDAARLAVLDRSRFRPPTSRSPTSTTCGCPSTAWSGRSRVATRSKPTTGSSTRHERGDEATTRRAAVAHGRGARSRLRGRWRWSPRSAGAAQRCTTTR